MIKMKARLKQGICLMASAMMLAGQMPVTAYADDEHIHEYMEPVFEWSDDLESCSATFECVDLDDEQEIEAQITRKTVDASCTEDGCITYTASVEFGGDTYTDIKTVKINAYDHEYETSVVEPKCTQDGYTRHTCIRCNEFYDDEVIPAPGHDYEAHMIEATCLDRGCTLHICSRCGDVFSDNETHSLGHDYVSSVIDPTCTERGYTLYFCRRCRQTEKNDEKDALGHDYSVKNVDQKASPVTEGKITYKCSRCDETRTEVILCPAQLVISEEKINYDGKEKKPSVKVYDSRGNLISASNYKVSYTNNTEVGNAQAAVEFEGTMYEGTLLESFEISDENILSGKCGREAEWTLNLNTGLMTISGKGAMEDYQYSTRTPWVKYRDKIKTVKIEKGITRIGTNAFYNCSELTDVTGCGDVLSIGINTFRNCKKLKRVTGCTRLTLVEQYAFCADTVLSYIGTKSGIVSLPACTKIGGYTFYECKGITQLATSDSMTYIGTRAFSNCTSMTSVKIGANCKTIASYAFCGNTELITVSGCAGLTGIGAFAFYQNDRLSTMEGCAKVVNLGASAFRNCKRLVKIGATAGQYNFTAVQTVGEYAFSGCIRAKCINLGSNLTSIGKYAFQNCIVLNGLYIRSTKLKADSVGEKAFFCMKYSCVIYVPASKLSFYRREVLAGKGQGRDTKIKSL